MHGINFEHPGPGKGFHITDYPEAEKVVAIKGSFAQQLADYSLHLKDLQDARGCLQGVADGALTEFQHSMLWRMAVINYSRCFKNNNARPNNLDIKRYINDPDGVEAHEYFIALRDKNIAHDDNPLTQCLPGAIVNKSDALQKIAKIITMSFITESYDQGSIKNLRQLIDLAVAYVTSEYDRICDEVSLELEMKTYSELTAMPLLQYSKPTPDIDVKVSRAKHV